MHTIKMSLINFILKKKKSFVEKNEDIELLRFFEFGIKIKMIKLSSGTVAVDRKKDIKIIEKLIKK